MQCICTDETTDKEKSTALFRPMSKEVCGQAPRHPEDRATGYTRYECSVAGVKITSHYDIIGDFPTSAYTVKMGTVATARTRPHRRCRAGPPPRRAEAKWLGAASPTGKPWRDIVDARGMNVEHITGTRTKLKNLLPKYGL